MLICCLAIMFFSSQNVDLDWDSLEQGVIKNRLRLLEGNNFDIQFEIESQEVEAANKYTMPHVETKTRFSSKGPSWRVSIVKKGESEYAATAKNAVMSRGEFLRWGGSVSVRKIGSTSSVFKGQLGALDFLSFDFRDELVQRGFIEEMSTGDLVNYGKQIERVNLSKAIQFARQHGGEIVAERINGLECNTVAWSGESISVCPSLNYALVRRAAKFPGTDLLKYEISCFDFRDVGRDFYAPSRFEFVLFGKPGEEPKLHNKRVGVIRYLVTEFEIDDTDDSVFDPIFPMGTIVHDFVRDVRYQTSKKGEIPFSQSISSGRVILNTISDKRDYEKSRRITIVAGAILLLLLSGGLTLVWRRRTSK